MSLSKLMLIGALVSSTSSLASAQTQATTVKMPSRVDLEDVNIEGEANKAQAAFLNRSKFGLEDRVKVRKNFRKEIRETVPDAIKDLATK